MAKNLVKKALCFLLHWHFLCLRETLQSLLLLIRYCSLVSTSSFNFLSTTIDIKWFLGSDPKKAFAIQRKFQARGPLVNSEYYTGWLDLWSKQHQTTDPTLTAAKLDQILAMNASVNMYMFEGGTNFGYMNGRNFCRPIKCL